MVTTLSIEAQKMVGLTEKAREEALNAARLKIAGALKMPPAPVLEDFYKRKVSKYPQAVSITIYALCVVMLVAAFLPSAMRLNAVGLDAFKNVIRHAFSMYVAALCFVLMAETGQVVFTLASAVAHSAWQKAGLIFGAAVCTAIALTGNALAVQNAPASVQPASFLQGLDASAQWVKVAFALLETYAPPLLVLVVSNILKMQIMDAISTHHKARTDYNAEHAKWLVQKSDLQATHDAAVQNAHLHHSWMRVSANALKEAVRRANAARTTVLVKLTDEDWRALVHRELNADAWYERSQTDQQPVQVQVQTEKQVTGQVVRARSLRVSPAGGAAGKHTGELRDSIRQNADGSFTGVCPRCGLVETRNSAASVRGALQAHIRHHHKPAAV